ncbi:MAG: GNAT family N-acetyltransferase [Methanosphaera sp. rholeuAM130]|nr:N-acetyltransferase [Methanosphaera sp.]RAP54499.1 MAG: GNAT family N-acetyltransferase [Methanosphaera sp. rholeuAM130]
MTIRLEERTDYLKVEHLIRDAFWNIYRPGCFEHYIVHNLRYDPSFIRQLDYVLEEDNRIIGHIAYSKNKLVYDNDKKIDVVTLGPVSIDPDYQGKGNGTKIINYTLDKAKELGIKYVFVIGDEKYYQRFGFEDASKCNIQFNDVEGDTPFFMIKVFDDEDLKFDNAKYIDNPIFNVDENKLEEFDKQFPEKIKEVRDTQLNV